MAIVGIIIVGVLVFFGLQLNPADAQAKDLPGDGDAHVGLQVADRRRHQPGRADAVPGRASRGRRRRSSSRPLADQVAETEGVAGAAAPPTARMEGIALVEAFSAYDGAAEETDAVIDRLKDDVLPAAAGSFAGGTTLTLAGGRARAARVHRRGLRVVPVRARVRRSS